MHTGLKHSLHQHTDSTYSAVLVGVFVLFTHDVQVQVKAADNSISKEAREALVEGFSIALTTHIPCLGADRCAAQ